MFTEKIIARQTPAMFGTLSFRKNAVDDPSVGIWPGQKPEKLKERNWSRSTCKLLSIILGKVQNEKKEVIIFFPS